MKRKQFIRNLAGMAILPGLTFKNTKKSEFEYSVNPRNIRVNGSMVGHKVDPISKVKVGVIGLGNRGQGLVQMFDWLIENDHAAIHALCDLDIDKIDKAEKHISQFQNQKIQRYSGTENAWRKLIQQDDLDLILICTPWRYHAQMAIEGMEAGKHVASEVPIAFTMEECWDIVSTSERTKKHCIMIENCCFNAEELFVLNMVQNGVFGDLTHAECAYNHDLRAHMLSETYYKDQWRIKHHVNKNGNFYTTHGLGPISFYLGIGRGDYYKFLTSVSSLEQSLSQAAKKVGSPFTDIKCGDVNTTLIKTEKGRSIMLQFDVHSGRPYSRINQLVGTKAMHEGYPSRLFIDGEKPEFYGHRWLNEDDYTSMRSKYEHPLIVKMRAISEKFKQGHGGMDFIMIYRLIRCLNLGVELDINVYDGVIWSAVTPLSELSVANQSQSVQFPDFMNTKWKGDQDLEVMRILD